MGGALRVDPTPESAHLIGMENRTIPAAARRLAAGAFVAAALGGAAVAQGAGDPAESKPPLGALLEDLLRPGGPIDEMTQSAREAMEALQRQTGPWADALGAVIADPDAYETPETLPNGDILIRKRPGRAPDAPSDRSDDAPTPPPIDL